MRILLIFIILTLSCQKKENKHIHDTKLDTTNNVVTKKVEPYFPHTQTFLKTKNLSFEIKISERDNLKNPLTKLEERFKKFFDTLHYQHYPVAERADLIEKYSLKKDSMLVTRQGENLIFNLHTGKKKILSNNPSKGDGLISFNYREYLEDIGYFVCFLSLYEGAHYMLIHAQTGEEFHINGIPKISPNKKRILSTAYDAGFYFNSSDLCIWKVEKQKLEIELVTILEDYSGMPNGKMIQPYDLNYCLRIFMSWTVSQKMNFLSTVKKFMNYTYWISR